MIRSARCLAAALALAGCSSTPPTEGSVVLSTGLETDTWTRSPAPQRIELRLTASSGSSWVLAETAAPAETVTVINGPYVGDTATFDLSGLDATGAAVVRGHSVPFIVDDLANFSIPLFVSRWGEWARPSDSLDQARLRPIVSLVRQQYLFAAGGDAVAGVDGAVPDVYDFGYWQTLHGQPRLARIPKSMATIENLLLVVDDAGATWVNVSTDVTTEAVAPAGLTFAEIAGGASVQTPDGGFFIVGATRTAGDPTAKILKVGADGQMEALSLSAPRLGAGAALAGGRLVVAGGSATGTGVEVLTQGLALTPLAFPPDPTVGMAIAAKDDFSVLLVGGTDPTGAAAPARLLDLSCTQACAATTIAIDPLSLGRAAGFPLSTGQMIAVGETAAGETVAYVVTAAPPSARALPLREPRTGAASVALSTGQIAIVGGNLVADGSPARHIEIFTP